MSVRNPYQPSPYRAARCDGSFLPHGSADRANDRLEYYQADFSSLDDVRRLAEAITAKHDRLEILVNNAGIGSTTRGRMERETSRDGHELRFAVNYLAPFLLTCLLMPLGNDAWDLIPIVSRRSFTIFQREVRPILPSSITPASVVKIKRSPLDQTFVT
jgi:NAD(P)-dependent dehydrogenase (short-subunit alcohol dehydrogenase family)